MLVVCLCGCTDEPWEGQTLTILEEGCYWSDLTGEDVVLSDKVRLDEETNPTFEICFETDSDGVQEAEGTVTGDISFRWAGVWWDLDGPRSSAMDEVIVTDIEVWLEFKIGPKTVEAYGAFEDSKCVLQLEVDDVGWIPMDLQDAETCVQD